MRTRAALALVVVAVAGCGGDDESADGTVTAPPLTVPGGDTGTQESLPTDTTTSPEPEPADTSGGAPVPELPDQQPDSPENDLPPPEDSPEERFEEFCNANPGACG